MGIVKKQVYKNTLISYAGMVLGYFNVLLYTQFLSTKQYGLYVLLINLSVLYSLIASMGVPSIIVRYFPFFKTKDGIHNGFFYWVGRLMVWSFLLSTVIYLLARPIIVSAYIKEAPLFIDYFYVLIPFAAFVVFYNFFEASGKVIYQSIFSAFLKDVLLKILTTVAILAYAKGWIDFRMFILIYVAFNGVISIVLFVSLVTTGQFKFGLKKMEFEKGKNSEIVSYGLFALLSSSVYVLWQKIDVVMLSAMAGLSITGVYGFYSSIALVINVPSAALSRTTYQIVADSWESKNMKAIADIYSKTSIIQMAIGCFLFIGIIINRNNLIQIIHKKEYGDHFDLFILIALGFLIDITGGLNAYIVVTSHKYRLYTVLVILASLFCIGLTYLLIPVLGGAGAALAYLITISGFNFCTWFYIKYRFKMQPFTYKHLVVILITAISYLAGHYFWRLPNLYLDIAIRSVLTAIIYGLLTYYFQISVDINEKVDKTIKKIIAFNQ
jgi:O-antigen/teichoic acid export membrane protein